ncbi:MAG: ROK family transcriptional regulator [Anaerolineae bacterium]|nr:ROK family transcriptional regulator [Anaerolineae bacterium]
MAGLRTINHVDMRNRNIAIIVNHLYQYAPISRAGLAKKTGLNKATVTSIIRILMENGFVVEAGTRHMGSSAGHPAIDLRINPDAGRVIGAEINAESIAVAVLDISPRIIWRETRKHSQKENADAVMEETIQLLHQAYARIQGGTAPVLGIVVALPGLVDLRSNVLLDAPDMGWKNVPIGRLIQDELKLPVAIGNSAHMASIAENYFGASKESEVSLFLNLGPSLGSGIVIMDNVLSGAAGLASEAGHMTVDPNGEVCSCGNIGCWNTVASLRALLKRVRTSIQEGCPSAIQKVVQGDLTDLNLDHVIWAAHNRDAVACRALEETGVWLGIGISNLINLLNPESIVLGGPMSAAYDFFLPSIQKEILKRAFVGKVKNYQITLAKYREDSCLVGSLAVIYWNLMNQLQYITLPEDGRL